MCFLYRYYSCCFTQDTEKALQDTLEFNKGFVLPLDEKTVRSQTRQAEKAYEEWLLNDFNLKGRILTKEEMEKVKKKKEIDRKSTRLNSSHANISYAVFC